MSVQLVDKPYMTIEMEHELWAVPCHIIADHRAKYYAANDPDTTYEEEYRYTIGDDYQIKDWAANNMDWDNVKKHAVRLQQMRHEPDYQEGWCNGEKEIIR